MKLTPEEKTERKRQRMIDKAREYQVKTYCKKFVSPVFQQMIRAEAGALPRGLEHAVADGYIVGIYREVGQCVCVTCGTVGSWCGGLKNQTMQTGHFLASRRLSILFEEDGVAPQCSRCNRILGGAPKEYCQWMLAMRGMKTVKRLTLLKPTVRQFTFAKLVDMRIEYAARLKAAIKRMESQ